MRIKRLIGFVAVAAFGYLMAFGTATGALFAAFVTLGAAGEIGAWATILRGARRRFGGEGAAD